MIWSKKFQTSKSNINPKNIIQHCYWLEVQCTDADKALKTAADIHLKYKKQRKSITTINSRILKETKLITLSS